MILLFGCFLYKMIYCILGVTPLGEKKSPPKKNVVKYKWRKIFLSEDVLCQEEKVTDQVGKLQDVY